MLVNVIRSFYALVHVEPLHMTSAVALKKQFDVTPSFLQWHVLLKTHSTFLQEKTLINSHFMLCGVDFLKCFLELHEKWPDFVELVIVVSAWLRHLLFVV